METYRKLYGSFAMVVRFWYLVLKVNFKTKTPSSKNKVKLKFYLIAKQFFLKTQNNKTKNKFYNIGFFFFKNYFKINISSFNKYKHHSNNNWSSITIDHQLQLRPLSQIIHLDHQSPSSLSTTHLLLSLMRSYNGLHLQMKSRQNKHFNINVWQLTSSRE